MIKFLLPTSSALLFFLSFHPANLGPLAWGALIPLIVYALREPNGKRVFFASWLGGAAFFVAGLFWIRHTAPFGPFGIGLYKGIYWALFALLLRRLCVGARWPVPLAAPVAWVTCEYVRGHLFGGLPWLLAGYSQHAALGVIQVADLGGVWLVSGLVLFVNGAAAEAILRPQGSRLWGVAALSSVLLAIVYGVVRLSSLPADAGPVVGIVQPNIPQDVKNLGPSDRETARRIVEKHLRMTRELVARSPDVALVVWPESVLQRGVFFDRGAGKWIEQGYFAAVCDAVRESGRPLLAGVLVGDLEGLDIADQTNSAILIDATGVVRARYDKMRLVQFTEMMPFEPVIPVKKIVAWFLNVSKVYEFTAGRGPAVFDVAGRPFGVCVCSENYYPDIWRKIARKGASAIVNISNEAWFRESAELDLMAAMAKFRAIENRVACVRGTNSGISLVLDAGGREAGALEGPGGARKSVEGTLAVAVPAGPGGSVYGGIGDAAAWLAAAAAVAGLAWSAFFAKR